VARERLVERLEQGAERKIVIVSAPAGFGTTTLVAEWLAPLLADERPAAWLSLEQSDNHAATFWTYLIAALQTFQPEVGAGVIALLESPRPPPIESLSTGLLNELSAGSRDFVLVLDDYHLIDSRGLRPN
jgi:LuxR family transcriptional regulator, maltose regulon positive regulatory protein